MLDGETEATDLDGTVENELGEFWKVCDRVESVEEAHFPKVE